MPPTKYNYDIYYLATLEAYKNEIFVPEYATSIKGIVTEILKDQSAGTVKKLRDAFMKLLINGVPNELIILNLVQDICSRVKSESVKWDIIQWAALYDNR